MSNKPNIIIVDDHDMFRDGIKSIIELEDVANVIAEASNGKEFIDLLKVHTPDMVLMDIDMPVLNGIDATRKGIELIPRLNVLALSMFGDEKYYIEMIEAGAKGFMLKSSNKSELLDAINIVAQGKSYFSQDLLQNIINNFGAFSKPLKTKKVLYFSEREIEVMQLLCNGLTTNEIAEELFLSSKTIENYRIKLLNKTNCNNSISLVVYALKHKIISF